MHQLPKAFWNFSKQKEKDVLIKIRTFPVLHLLVLLDQYKLIKRAQ